MKKEVQKLLEKADHALEVAESLLKQGFAQDAASKLYYAMFYATQALLKSEGIDVVKHSAVESALGYHFAKTGRIEPKYHRMLINARKVREIVDYDIQEEIIEPTEILKSEDGKEFVAVMKAMILKT
ncbi:MAG: HEPN domain-containing protein [Deltaproteobacteria bacterium]|nr:HEPN domain-containing protein [Deltaproteobacteria bacterium]